MKKATFIPTAILSLTCLAAMTLFSAQSATKSPEPTRREQRVLAVGLLRSINTAEMNYRQVHGNFAPWPVLLQNETQYFRKAFFNTVNSGPLPSQMRDDHLAEMHLTAGPEILPGWNLRLNVHADGQGYDVLLEDLSDKHCGYAALTDEIAIIRQSKTIDCDL
jgi:hypothetical protein